MSKGAPSAWLPVGLMAELRTVKPPIHRRPQPKGELITFGPPYSRPDWLALFGVSRPPEKQRSAQHHSSNAALRCSTAPNALLFEVGQPLGTECALICVRCLALSGPLFLGRSASGVIERGVIGMKSSCLPTSSRSDCDSKDEKNGCRSHQASQLQSSLEGPVETGSAWRQCERQGRQSEGESTMFVLSLNLDRRGMTPEREC
ncbi:MAG: hypothetical protein ACI841_001794 [Planctomycetota bacterium]|jgi:hypothetical protein